jgi:CRISPR-associated protein Cmr3
MNQWKITPRDALIFRDGKPFTADAGAKAKSLPFPFPSSIAGAVRTMAGIDPAIGEFDTQKRESLLKKKIRGPFLAEEADNGNLEWLAPAPADCLMLNGEKKELGKRIWLNPIDLQQGEITDLKDTSLIGPAAIIEEKPHAEPPRFWKWRYFNDWLIKPGDDVVSLQEIGCSGPMYESRMHVSMNPETGTAIFGALFRTSGLEFIHLRPELDEKKMIKNAKALSLLIETDADLKPGIGFLGGERRVVQWEKAKCSIPHCPQEIRDSIDSNKTCRLILLTPAIFDKGFLPTWLQKEFAISITGVVLPRYQVTSGWDYEKGKPKPTRRLVPAGSVYYLRLDPHQNIEEFIEKIWLANISDTEQDRLDGFGLAALGNWDGRNRTMEMEEHS